MKKRLSKGIVTLLFCIWGCGIQTYAAEEQLEVKEVYHEHTGDTTNGGGCYTVQKTRTEYKTCNDYARHVWDGDESYTSCPYCGNASYKAKYHYEKFCPTTQQAYGNLGTNAHYVCCSNVESSGQQSYSYSHQVPYDVIYYELGCGKDETTLMGTINISKSVGGGQYFLKVSCTGLITIDSYSWSTGTSTDTLEVTANGTYSCTIDYSESGRSDSVTFSYEVTDYDVTPPDVTVLYDDSTWSKSKTITVNATDSGVGLHAEAYRFHNGTDWSQWSGNNTYEATTNGTYLIEVRDAFGNVAQETVTFTKIDNIGPSSVNTYDDSIWSQSKTITVNATDSGVGLHIEAYRFQGGEWTKNNCFTVTGNGTYSIEVRDALENVSLYSVTITHIDNQVPDVTLHCDDSIWSKKKTISVVATDSGSGLSASAYRFNGGAWGSGTEYEATGNGTYSMEVMDNAGNVAQTSISITHIDNGNPIVEISFDDSTWSRTKTITVTATDSGSGLPVNAYRFHNGTGWSVWSEQTEYEITVNNMYLFEVQDNLGNVTQKSIFVSKIDSQKPTVSANVSDANAWKTNKTLTLNATDESGISKYEYSFDGDQWFAGGNTLQVDKNCRVYYRVTDNAGNVSSSVVSVEMIDNVAPTVTLNTYEASAGIIAVNASDAESGLDTAAYSYSRDGKTWSEWISNKKFIVKDNGYIYVKVRDKAGNITGGDDNQKLRFYIEIDKEPPTVSVTISEDGKYLIITAEDKNLHEKPYQYGDEEWTDVNTYLLQDIQDELVITVRDIAGNLSNVTYVKPGLAASLRRILGNETLQRVATVTTGTTSTMAVTFGFVFFFFGFGNVKVYGFDDKGKRIHLCNVSLSKKGTIKISKYRLKKNKTNSIVVKFSSGIVKRRKGELVSIHVGSAIISKAIQNEITLTY